MPVNDRLNIELGDGEESSASTKCTDWTASHPAKSAVVRPLSEYGAEPDFEKLPEQQELQLGRQSEGRPIEYGISDMGRK